MKILIIRFSSIGDIVLTTPVVRVLKTRKEDYEIHYATKREYENMLTENPYIDRIHLLDGKLSHLIKKLKKEKFDFVVDLHHNVRTSMIKRALGVKSASFRKLNIQKWLKVNFKIDLLPNKHIVDRYFETIGGLDLKSDNLGLEYFIPEKDEVDLNWLPESFRKRYVVVVIGGKYFTKKLPFERIIELCDRINKPVVLLGGPDESELGERIEKFFERRHDLPETESKLKDELGKKTEIFNGCGKFNINQSASLIRQSVVVFSHDTGLMHIAAAFKKKIYSIWGNTIPEFGMYPYRTQFVIFENKNLSCRPCSKIGFSKCPKGHFKCMNEQVFDFYIPEK